MPAERLVKVPAGVSDEQAAALMLKGLTAQFLIRRTYRVARGDTILVHAAAGGVGLILCQWAKALGATVIGVVGSEAKAELATKHGCRHVLISGRDELVAGVKALTRGAGVAVVYDAVGKDTFMDSLDCLRRLGMMVSYGNASGPPPAISPLELTKRGSLFLTRPSLFNYIATREELAPAARELFAAVKARKVRVVIGQRYPLAQAAEAHRDLEGRRTTGSTVLFPMPPPLSLERRLGRARLGACARRAVMQDRGGPGSAGCHCNRPLPPIAYGAPRRSPPDSSRGHFTVMVNDGSDALAQPSVTLIWMPG